VELALQQMMLGFKLEGQSAKDMRTGKLTLNDTKISPHMQFNSKTSINGMVNYPPVPVISSTPKNFNVEK